MLSVVEIYYSIGYAHLQPTAVVDYHVSLFVKEFIC